ncbi:acyltransferase [Bacillus sp. JJ1609]|uniref:acyltransferase family protein n=1 Tax=Bacillus sp. JJ1609 TaxID=3122977 RepID=UPI002FFF0AF8
MKRLLLNFSKANDLLEGNVSIYLDLIRGISAVLVVMEHLSSRLFVGYGNVEHQNIFVIVLYLLNILGGPSVIIFFVLSGLFISRSVLKAIKENKWSWKSYLVNRLSRLYVVLIPALILTFVLDSISVNYFGYKGYNSGSENLLNFIGNVFYLQNIFVGVYGSNAPLWSLNYEFWYYMLFPALFLFLFTKRNLKIKIIYFLSIVLFISIMNSRMDSYFAVWLVGTCVLLVPRKSYLINRFTPFLAIGMLLIIIPIRPLIMTGRLFTNQWTEDLLVVDLLIGLAFGFFIYTMLHIVSDKIKHVDYKRLGKVAKLLAGFSFSLYLIHYPIINTVYYWSAHKGFTGLQPSFTSVLIEILLVILICFIAYLFSKITEGQTHKVRSLFLGRKRAFIIPRSEKVVSKEII